MNCPAWCICLLPKNLGPAVDKQSIHASCICYPGICQKALPVDLSKPPDIGNVFYHHCRSCGFLSSLVQDDLDRDAVLEEQDRILVNFKHCCISIMNLQRYMRSWWSTVLNDCENSICSKINQAQSPRISPVIASRPRPSCLDLLEGNTSPSLP